MNCQKFALLIAFCIASAFAQAYPTYNVDRPYTLRYLDYSPLLYRYHDITAGSAPQTFFYPQIDSAYRQKKDSSSLLFWHAEDGRAMLNISPVLAWDIRGGEQFGDTIKGYEGGLFMSGYIDSAEFWLDARIFSEGRSEKEHKKWKSWDREFIEKQGNKDNQGSGALKEVDYSSYARYRGHIAMRMGWAVLDFARDVAHWGPGYYNNLTLNQGAVPYNQITLSTKIGPLSVVSLYADLDPGSHSMRKDVSRNLYGHRYELELGDLTLGISEITVVYDINPYWLFVPIVPLFAEKGNYSEDNNNGAIAFDFSYRLPFGLRLYSEFFLDDMESPTSLLRNDNIEAKWAGMIGAEYAGNFGAWKVGSIAEYARIEPYVYTHFKPNTAQIAHLNYPIGSQAGPNSLAIDWLVYARNAKHFQMQLKQGWLWKGNDGGEINEPTPTHNHHSTEKHFLDGAKMQYTLTPAIAYMNRHYAISAEYSFFDRNAFCARAMFLW
ncbi:MAG: capsule assembly Wzi family protein [Fibromonadales bacterium]|nr:capsule assembly Wzi family protein [Fibromonadales bacterium]